jgi:hypothetical protein
MLIRFRRRENAPVSEKNKSRFFFCFTCVDLRNFTRSMHAFFSLTFCVIYRRWRALLCGLCLDCKLGALLGVGIWESHLPVCATQQDAYRPLSLFALGRLGDFTCTCVAILLAPWQQLGLDHQVCNPKFFADRCLPDKGG